MGLPRWLRVALRLATGVILAFIYVPIGDHRPVFVQRAKVATWPITGVHARLVRARRSATRASAPRSDLGPGRASARRCRRRARVARGAGGPAVPFFGRETLALHRGPAARPARHRHRHRPEHGVPDGRLRLRADDDHRRPRHVLRGRRLQQRRRPAAALLAHISRRPRRTSAPTRADLPRITFPAIRTALLAGALLAFALSFDEIIVTNFTGRGRPSRHPDLDLHQLPAAEPAAARQRGGGPRPDLLSIVPVYVASRLTTGIRDERPDLSPGPETQRLRAGASTS